MIAQRATLRAARAVRVNAPAIKRNVRFAGDDARARTADAARDTANSPALYGSLGGAAAATLVCYAFYQASGASSAVRTAKQAKSYFDSATEKLKVKFEEVTPEPNQAIETLRSTANRYAAFVPGGQQYVDKAFQDLEYIRKQHGSEVDEIVKETYGQLRDASKKGVNLETLYQTWDILSKQLQRVASLAGDAAQDILNNHPELKDKLGGNVEQLKQLGERFGPEVKEQVNQTFNEISDILKQGIQWNTVDRIRSLVQDKTQQLQKFQQKAFDQGWEQLKPMLDKSPQVKQLVEKNLDTLKQGNVTELISKVREAVSSGNTGDLDKYIKQATEKGQQFAGGSGLGSLFNMIPQGSQIMPQLQKLAQVAEQQGSEAQQLARDTVSELSEVLRRRGQKLEQLWQEGQKKAGN